MYKRPISRPKQKIRTSRYYHRIIRLYFCDSHHIAHSQLYPQHKKKFLHYRFSGGTLMGVRLGFSEWFTEPLLRRPVYTSSLRNS